MAYFANGTEGEMYEAKYCRRCIPREGIENLECRMFVEKSE